MMVTRNSKKASVKASNAKMPRRKIRANEELEDAVVEVEPEATDLLFEAEDVAELVAEVTGEDVGVEVVEDSVVFTVGEEEFTVEPDGDEEILEASTKILSKKAPVKASKRTGRAMRRR